MPESLHKVKHWCISIKYNFASVDLREFFSLASALESKFLAFVCVEVLVMGFCLPTNLSHFQTFESKIICCATEVFYKYIFRVAMPKKLISFTLVSQYTLVNGLFYS